MTSKTTGATSLERNPFWILGVTTRDDRHRIVERAEDRALEIDPEQCQSARTNLVNPRSRLSAEMSWLPGVAPKTAENLVRALAKAKDPISIRVTNGLPQLARANLMAAALECVPEQEAAEPIARFICEFADAAEAIESGEVFRDINEDRAVARFPDVQGIDNIEEELATRNRAYRDVVRSVLDSMEATKLVDVISRAVDTATEGGEVHGPALLHEVVDSYEKETQRFFDREHQNILGLIADARTAVPSGEPAVTAAIERLADVVRNFQRVARPIQVSMKARGLAHRLSRDVAYEVRNLGLHLCNEHGMLTQASMITEWLREWFSDVPEIAERAAEDSEALQNLTRKAEEREKDQAKWERAITFRAEVGAVFKDELSISPKGITYKNQTVGLDAVTHVRWGGIRHSLNGIPTGTTYTIGVGNGWSGIVIELRKESTYSGFLSALWPAVCIRLVLQMGEALAKGQSLQFGDIGVEDSAVTLTRHKFLGSERVRLDWSDVQIWNANGSFVVGAKADKKIYASASYINAWNTHILEHVVRGAFKKGVDKLSEYFKD